MIPTRRARTFGVLVTALVALGAAGCVRVQPHQRGLLASRVMRPNPDPNESSLDGHLYTYREGSIGGSGVGGGGCGCD